MDQKLHEEPKNFTMREYVNVSCLSSFTIWNIFFCVLNNQYQLWAAVMACTAYVKFKKPLQHSAEEIFYVELFNVQYIYYYKCFRVNRVNTA